MLTRSQVRDHMGLIRVAIREIEEGMGADSAWPITKPLGEALELLREMDAEGSEAR
jgi:hypothetical protein